jgi:RNA polymerase sigma-70 factor (ECF subfamily)
MDDQDAIGRGTKTLRIDADLIEEAKTSPESFKAIYQHWAVPMYKYIFARVRNPQDCEDITSQVFLTALQALPRYKHKGFFSAWLFGIARNKIKEYFRNNHRSDISTELFAERIVLQNNPNQAGAARDDIEILNQHIQSLPEADQELILLRYVARLKFTEIGAVMKKSTGSVKKKLYRIQYKLEEIMENQNE